MALGHSASAPGGQAPRGQAPGQAPGQRRFAPLLGGLALVGGSLELIGLRLVVWLAGSLPLLATTLARAEAIAVQPYFTDVAGRLPVAELLRLGAGLGSDPLLGLAVSALLLLAAEQVLVAGALRWLDPNRDASAARRSAPRLVAAEGPGWLLVFFRVVLVAGVLLVAGRVLIGAGFAALQLYGEGQGWSGRALRLTLPVGEALATLLWASLVGAFAFWCRLVSVADGRRRLRRTALVVLSVFARHPLRSAAFYVVVTTVTLALSGAVLVLWRQHPPRGAGLALVLGGWLAALVLRCWAWHWLIRAGHLLYAGDRCAELRQQPDAPLRPLRWIRQVWRLYSRRVG